MTLLWLGAAFIAGVVLGAGLVVPLWLTATVLGGAILLSVSLRRSRWWLLPLVLAAGLMGLVRAPHSTPASSSDLRSHTGHWVSIEGTVVEEPDIRDTGSNYVVAADALIRHGRAVPVGGRALVHTPRAQVLEYGERVLLTGRLLAPKNTSRLPYADILARRGITTEMRFPRSIDLGPGDAGPGQWIVPLRQRLEAGIDRWLPEPEAALLIAITLGARSASLGDLAPILVQTGLIHVIAISGIKVAMVAGTVYAFARLGRNRLAALVVSLAVLFIYVVLTGATASGERSALMWTMVFIAAYLGRWTVAPVSLGFVAALMVAVDPGLPWDIGFQLSVIGTLAIIMLTEPLLRIARPVPSPFREALCVTAAAQVGTLPIVAIGFHLVSISGLVANALVLPLLPLLIALGFLLGVLSPLAAAASPLSALAYALLHVVVIVSQRLAALPGSLGVDNVAAPFTLIYYGALTAGAILLLRAAWDARERRPLGPGREILLSLTIGAVVLSVTPLTAADASQPRVQWLGSGDALLLRSDRQIVVIDGSPRPFDLLERLGQMLPYSTHTIDLVIVTDPRSSNVAGLDALLSHYSVSEVLDVGSQYPSTTYARWRGHLREQRVPTFALRTGARVRLPGVTVTALGPDAVTSRPQDSAGLLRISMHGRSLLVAGTASPREQREALFRGISLRADALLVDGAEGLDPDFRNAVQPRLVLTTHTGRISHAVPLRSGSTVPITLPAR